MTDFVDVKKPAQAQVTEEEAWEMSVARKIMHALSKAITNTKFYLPNNPLVRRSRAELYEELSKFLQAWSTMSLDVTDTEILYKGKAVYQGGDKARSLTFLLYRDGLRSLAFHKGLSPEELGAFVDIVCQAISTSEDETDVVGALWAADFVNIEYSAVDVCVDVEGGPLEAPSSERPQSAEGGRVTNHNAGESGAVTALSPSQLLESEFLQHEKEWAERQLFERFNVDDVRGEVQRLAQFSPLSRLGDILLDLFELEDSFSERRHLVDLLEDYVKELVSQQRLSQASSMIREARETLENFVSEGEDLHELADSFSERISSAVGSETLRKVVAEAFPQRPTEVLDFLKLVGPGTIPILTELVLAARDVRSRASLRAALTALAGDDISKLDEAIHHRDARVVREAVAVIGRIGDPKGTKMLRGCLGHKDVSVRIQAVHALRKIGNSEANKLTVEFLEDPDPEVRILAAKTIDVSQDESIRQILKDAVTSRSFSLRPTRERIALIDALKRANSDDVVPTLAPFFRRGLFRRKEEDSVLIAIVGTLSSTGTEPARKLLERGSKWGRKAVARECSRALQRFTAEPVENGGPNES